MPGFRKGCAVAFGVNDPLTGTEKLIVVAETYELGKERQQAIRAEIIENMAITLGIPPDAIILVPPRTIPKTSSGKLQRSACKYAYTKGKLKPNRVPVKLQIVKLALMSLGKKSLNWLSYLGKLAYTTYAALIFCLTFPFAWLSVLALPSKAAAKFVRFWARNLFRLIGCPISIKGKNNLRTDIPIIFAANHASYIDALLLLGILPAGIIFYWKKRIIKEPISAHVH